MVEVAFMDKLLSWGQDREIIAQSLLDLQCYLDCNFSMVTQELDKHARQKALLVKF